MNMLRPATARVLIRLIAVFFIFAPPLAFAVCANDPVVANSSDSGAGSLRDAISIACDSSTISFSNTNAGAATNFYDGNQHTITLTSGVITVTKNVTINGPGPHVLTVSGNHTDLVLKVNSAINVALNDLTIADGENKADGAFGGGIYNVGNLTITNCTVTGNSITNNFLIMYGGGIYNNGTLTLTNSTVSDNSAAATTAAPPNGSYVEGSGIFNDSSGVVTITGSTISNNKGVAVNAQQAAYGGGIYNLAGSVTISKSTITGNTCGSAGASGGIAGGISNNGGTMLLTDSIVSDNSVSGTGYVASAGIETSNSGPTTIVRSTISGNSCNGGSYRLGGGITASAPMDIVDSTISNNSAGVGGGIAIAMAAKSDIVAISNSTISGNSVSGANFGAGAGVEILEGTLNVIGSTISGNTASGVSNSAGGGIWNDLSLNNNSGIVNSRNSIIAGNAAAADLDISGSINSKGHNLIGNSTGATITGDTASNVLNQDTNLASLANNGGTTQTKRVLPASPAIDAGADFTTLTSAVDASTTSINVADATGFPAAVNYFIKIDDERMKVTARNGNTATVARGATPAAHASGAGVNPAFDQRGQTRKAGSSLDIGSFETNYTLSLGAGNSQSATVGSAFGTAFHFTVIENGHPLAGVSVTFTAPPGGASGTFAGASNSVTVTTDANGIATSPVFTANTKVGSYSVAVGFGGNGTTFFYDLTNNPGPLNHVSVTAPTAATSGAAFNATVSAVDEFDNVITSYKGTVHFTSTDTQANLPADSTLSNGTATFSAVLRTTGNQTISATDKLSSSITGTSAAVSVGTTVTFLNISTRMEVLTDDNVLIAGFIIRGQPNTTKKIMIRGLGPSLAAQAVPNPLPDPLLELHGPSGFATITNDNWQEAGNTSEIPNGFQPSDSHESVIVAQLPIGANGLSKFTAIVRGAHGESGVGLVEAYDLQPAANQFANISTRGFIDTGDNVMIGGIILGGGTNGALTKVLVRAIGPSLSAQGVNGALQDPTLELRNKSGDLVAKNDNWRETQEQAIKDTTVPPTDDRESAIVATLPGGNYTAIVRGKSDGTGIGLIELFNLQ